MAKKRSQAPIALPAHLRRSLTWRGLAPHDEIKVRGKSGQRRRWEFLAFVENLETGECHIEVVGGKVERSGRFQKNVHAFPADRCSVPRRRRPKRTTEDSDQLSFDLIS